MASILPGYEYDIFVSYRQKDNRYDHWVTGFVANLRAELEATFKEDISIYFDENPSDGLLETHDVGKSLDEKLRCLILIPIISQTYCDPKCFAWQHEFCVFNRLAKEDKFGRDIRLASGNVASRILPVQIHDLDADDRKLVEDETGGFMRGIEFIYREAGVNRPLKPDDDARENLNRTSYRNQVNKVANAVKEIISTLKKPSAQQGEIRPDPVTFRPVNKRRIRGIIALSVIITLLVVAGILFIPGLSGSAARPGKTVAVLLFENLNLGQDDAWFTTAMTDELISQLYKVREITVRPRTSVMQYSSKTKSIPEIGNELKVNYVVEGSLLRIDNQVKVRVTLINAAKDIFMWDSTCQKSWEEISSLQNLIAMQIAGKLKAVLTPDERARMAKSQKNPEAYKYYHLGRNLWYMRTQDALMKSLEYFSKSIEADPGYAEAYTGMADSYYILAWYGWYSPRREGYARAKEFVSRALEIDPNSADAHAILGSLLCWSEWNWEEAGKELRHAIELNPNCVTAHQYYSELLDITRNNPGARDEINIALDLDPLSTSVNVSSGLYYYNEGKTDEALKAYQKALEINPAYNQALYMNFEIYLKMGEGQKAFDAIKKYMLADQRTQPYAGNLEKAYAAYGINGATGLLIELLKNFPGADLYVAKLYAMTGKKEEALASLEKIIDLHSSDIPSGASYPDEIPRIYNSPGFDNLRSEPQFREIIRKMGLSEY